MELPKEWILAIPPSSSNPTILGEIRSSGVIVVVGANGSGKTRLGSWIDLESDVKDVTLRVAAQKSLEMPAKIISHDINIAQRNFWYGHENGTVASKKGNKWDNRPATFQLNDYERLLILLFSEETEKCVAYKRAAKDPRSRGEPPVTKLDICTRVWETVLPLRQLVIGARKIEAKIRGKSDCYPSTEMSDGERVVLYLIGECLAAPLNGVIIVDEPELHLHKSIQARLWNEIEAERSDCLFVYLTHDLEFAASRKGATKVWLREFYEKAWDWSIVPKEEGIPEDLLLTLLGSRKPILFVEGSQGSWDCDIHGRVYPEFTIVPSGGAEGVIHATVTFSARKELHHLECRGLIDRDFRSQERIAYLQDKGVYAAAVSEVENIFFFEDVLKAIAEELVVASIEEAIAKVKAMVLEQLRESQDRVISEMTAAEIEARFKEFDAKATGKDGLKKAVDTLVTRLDSEAIHAIMAGRIAKILADKDYAGAIQVFNDKGLLHRVGNILQAPKDVESYLERLIKNKKGQKIIEAMRKCLPVIPIAGR